MSLLYFYTEIRIVMRFRTIFWLSVAFSLVACSHADEERALALADSRYQEARELEDAKSYKEATANYLEAISLVKDIDQVEGVRLKGLAQYRLGVVYRSQAMYEEALEMDRASLSAFSSIADSSRMLHSIWNMAREFSALKRYDSCKYYYDQALIMSEWISAEHDRISILGEIGSQYYRKIGDYPHAISYLELAEDMWEQTEDENKEFYSTANDLVLAYLYFITHEDPKAWDYAQKGLANEKTENRVTCYQILYEIAKKGEDQDTTLYYADAFIKNLTENFTLEKSHSVQKVRNEYEMRLQADRLQQKSRRRLYGVLVASSLALVLVLLMLWLLNRKRLKERLALEEVKNELLRNENRISELTDRLHDILVDTEAQRTALVENSQREKVLCNRLLEISNVYKVAKSIEHKEYNYKGVLEESDWDDFVVASNAIFDGFIDKIGECHQDLSKWDIRTICLLKHGFSHDTIAYLLNIQTQSLKKRLYRMKYEKLSDSRSLDEIINEHWHE